MADLMDLTRDLDIEMGSIGTSLNKLKDVDSLFLKLAEEMDEAISNGEEKVYFQSHHRMIRVLSELMHYAMSDINEHYENATEIHSGIYEVACENKKSPFAAIELASR
jgi:hypothetical protein